MQARILEPIFRFQGFGIGSHYLLLCESCNGHRHLVDAEGAISWDDVKMNDGLVSRAPSKQESAQALA